MVRHPVWTILALGADRGGTVCRLPGGSPHAHLCASPVFAPSSGRHPRGRGSSHSLASAGYCPVLHRRVPAPWLALAAYARALCLLFTELVDASVHRPRLHAPRCD